nr:NAD(P)H-dependent oxidoreductase subunit E [Maliibacterium massiliense]
MKLTICIGSACHLKGSHQVIESLQRLIKAHNVSDKVELAGSFCKGECQSDVCVTVDGNVFSVKPEDVETFFADEVLGKI